jgi:hypothetical protein
MHQWIEAVWVSGIDFSCSLRQISLPLQEVIPPQIDRKSASRPKTGRKAKIKAKSSRKSSSKVQKL